MPQNTINSDLHLYFCEPYCPRCHSLAFLDEERGEWLCDCEIPEPADFTVGLHTRDPRTQVEGLEWQGDDWILCGDKYREIILYPAHASDLLIQGVWSAAFTKGWGGVWGPDADGFRVCIGPGKSVCAPTLPHAVALAMHRALDAEEGG